MTYPLLIILSCPYCAYSHDELNQKWYYDGKTKGLKTYYDDKCLDLATEAIIDIVDNQRTKLVDQWDLYMNEECHGGSNQQFLVPMLWLPSSYLDEVRIFYNRTLCMTADTDDYNNVHMADCEAGNINQHFNYDHTSEVIKGRGFCLDYNTGNDNVAMYPWYVVLGSDM